MHHYSPLKTRKTGKKLLLLAAAAVFFLQQPLQLFAATRDEIIAAQRAKTIETNQITGWPEGPVVTADSAILIDAQTGVVLYAKDAHKQQYPASTTKILTSLIAAEQCEMDEVVTFSYKAVHDNPYDGSHIGIDKGEKITMEQCLSAILIASANEVAFGVAEHIAGESWENFIPLMNQRAQELGCLNSNFVNPNGLHHEEHVTTAYDLAMIGKAFFANELLCKFSSTRVLHIPPTDHQPHDIYAASTNQMLPTREYAYQYLVAGKTGYTDQAKSCLISCAEKDGLKLICVVLHDYSPRQYEDTIALLDYGFANFERINISQTETKYDIDHSNFFYSENDIFGSSKPILSLNTQDCITLPKTVPFTDIDSSISYEATHATQANQVAVITYTYQDQYLGKVSVDLATDRDISYSFETPVLESIKGPSAEAQEPDEDKVVFINIFKILGWILGLAVGILLLIILVNLIRNYHFSSRERNNRRNWKRRRRRRGISPAARRRRRSRTISRFRDYD